MTRRFTVNCVARLMECLLPRALSEVVVGDLYEEQTLLSSSIGRARATRWFVGQALKSMPRLIFLSARRWSWLKSLGIAAIAFAVLGRLEPLVHRWISGHFNPSVGQQMAISLLIGFGACACGGFLSTWLRRGSALLYSLIGTSFLVFAIVSTDTSEPLWFLGAFVITAMLAPLVGGMGFVSLDEWRQRRRTGG